jgi:hypothetical protein
MKIGQIIISSACVGTLGLALLAVAQQSPWGGRGQVTAPKSVAIGEKVLIKYLVTESKGTGNSSFQCEVINPDGIVHIAKKASNEWNGGRAEASFTYPDDFAGNNISRTTQTAGMYKINCWLNVAGSGMDAKAASASGYFTVK